MLIRPQHPDMLSPLATDLALQTPWFPKMGITQRGMGWIGGGCGCCDTCPYGGPPDCQARPDGTVTWFTHEVDEETGEITRLDHSGRCFTVYVDSVSGDVDETGNGTEERPFVNLNSVFQSNITKSGTGSLSSGVFTPDSAPTEWAAGRLIGAKLVLDGTDYEVTANTTTTATIDNPPDDDDSYSWTLKIFDDDCIYNICTHSAAPDNCPKVKVLVKGTIDYVIVGNWRRNYGLNLVIEPWANDTLVMSIDRAGEQFTVVYECLGCIWKHVDITCFGTAVHGFYLCGGSAFDSCLFSADNVDVSSTHHAFRDCSISAFDLCYVKDTRNYQVIGFDGCEGSTFNECVYAPDMSGMVYDVGFLECHDSVFSSCVSTAISTLYQGIGFWKCNSSVFSACVGSGTGDSDTYANGYGYGFTECIYGVFISCSGVGDVTGAQCKRACGFYKNDCSFFTGCTSSDRICEDCSAATCTAFVCDDFDNDVQRYEETIEGVFTLAPSHSILDIRETIEGVLSLAITHSIE